MRRTRVPRKDTRYTKSPELNLRNTGFSARVNLFFTAMSNTVDRFDQILDFLSENKYLKSSRGISSVGVL